MPTWNAKCENAAHTPVGVWLGQTQQTTKAAEEDATKHNNENTGHGAVVVPGIIPPPPPRKGSIFLTDEFWTVAWRLSVLLLIFLATVFVSIVIIRGGLTSNDIADSEFMRGLITALLLVGTLVLVTILILNVLFATGDESTGKRANLAREVITPLFGILGTIVGFYFGSHGEGKPRPGTEDANKPRQAAPADPAPAKNTKSEAVEPSKEKERPKDVEKKKTSS